MAISQYGDVITSPDGHIWSQQAALGLNLHDVASDGTSWAVVGEDGIIYTSVDDGATWTQRLSPTAGALNGIEWANGEWVAVGRNGTILTSTDAADWTPHSIAVGSWGPVTLYDVTGDGDRWVVVGEQGSVFSAVDTSLWTAEFIPGLTGIPNAGPLTAVAAVS